MYSNFESPPDSVFVFAVASLENADDQSVDVESVAVADGVEVGDNFTSVMKKMEVVAKVKG